MAGQQETTDTEARRKFQQLLREPDSDRQEADHHAGLCFACGRQGHWRQDCPTVKATEGKGHHEKLSIHSKIGIFKASDLLIERHTCKPKSSNIISPVGRLRSRYNNLANITSNSYILDIVDHGYKIPFINTPPSVILDNNLSARSNLDFVSEEIKMLLQKGCISECDKIPQIVNPLTVAYNRNGKPRLVLDCRSINPLLYKYKFRMEDTICARQMFKDGDYMCTFDLRSAYHHILITQEGT